MKFRLFHQNFRPRTRKKSKSVTFPTFYEQLFLKIEPTKNVPAGKLFGASTSQFLSLFKQEKKICEWLWGKDVDDGGNDHVKLVRAARLRRYEHWPAHLSPMASFAAGSKSPQKSKLKIGKIFLAQRQANANLLSRTLNSK